MFRTLIAIFTAVSLTATAGAQPKHQLPLSPGVHSGSSIGPGTQFIPLATPRFVSPAHVSPGVVARPGHFATHRFSGYGYGGYGYGGYGYNYGYAPFSYVYGGGYPPESPLPPPPPTFDRNIMLANEFPATLTIQFPSASRMWLNGNLMGNEVPEEHVLTSPDMRPGETHTFEVKLRWTAGDKTYESSRSVTLGHNERGRLLIVSGTEVK